MPTPLTVGGVLVRAISFRALEPEAGGADWMRRRWELRVWLEYDAEAAELATAIQAAVARGYRRSINGQLVGGPIIACDGDPIGPLDCGVEIGGEDFEPHDDGWDRILTLTLREA